MTSKMPISNNVKVALLHTSVNCSYADSSTIGYRPLMADRPDIYNLSGYPTGKTILAKIPVCSDNLIIGCVSLYDGRYVNANSKTQAIVSVDVYVFYID